MFTLLTTIVIVYVLWLVVKPLVARYARHKFQQRMNDMFNQAFGSPYDTPRQDPGESFWQRAYRRATGQPHKRKREKAIPKDVGEYVEFEEIDVKWESKKPADPNYNPTEPQVSDADWEDIR